MNREHLNDLFQKDLYKNINPNFKNIESNFSVLFHQVLRTTLKSHIDRQNINHHIHPDIS